MNTSLWPCSLVGLLASLSVGCGGEPDRNGDASPAPSSVDASAADGSAAEASSAGNAPADGSGLGDGASDSGGDVQSGTLTDKMTFFATSVGSGTAGGNLGGLAGADAKCLALATAVGAKPRTWRAYLSTAAADARDRIGAGPWVNVLGQTVATSVSDLHAQGAGRGPAIALLVDERGAVALRSEHDILTGSNDQGLRTTATCSDWTSNSDAVQGRVGHADWSQYANGGWNSVHTSTCSASGLVSNNGAGRTYCFAID